MVSLKRCPTGKELNAKTNRCRKKCSLKTVRNSKGRCVKVKRKASVKGSSKRASVKRSPKKAFHIKMSPRRVLYTKISPKKSLVL